jgi:hypothetical protein
MIKGAIGKVVANCMARSTIGGRGGMRIGCLRFSYGSGRNIISTTVMTRLTVAGNTRVIEDRWLKRIIIVANVAILARWQMTGRLDDIRVAVSRGQEWTVMTSFATADNTGVNITDET